MHQFIEMSCPQCQRALRIRASYVGLRLACKHCQHKFRVSEDNLPAQTVPTQQSVSAKEDDLTKSRPESVATVAVNDPSAPQLQLALANLTASEERLKLLQGKIDQARNDRQQALNLRQELDGIVSERDALRDQIHCLQQKIAQVEASKDHDLAEANHQVAAARAERDAEAARAQQLQSRIEDLERSHVELGREHDEARLAAARALSDARGSWDEKRSSLRTQWEAENLNSLQAAAQQLCDERSRADAERQRWSEEKAKARVGFEQEYAALRAEVEAAQRQSTTACQERDELTTKLREAERRRDELAAELQRAQSERDAQIGAQDESTTQLAALQAEIEGLRRNEAEVQARLTDLLAELQAARDNLAESERQLVLSREQTPASLTAETNGLDQPVEVGRESFEQERKVLQSELTRQRDEIESLKNTLQSLGIFL
jgi:chromosome segregation ATPase